MEQIRCRYCGYGNCYPGKRCCNLCTHNRTPVNTYFDFDVETILRIEKAVADRIALAFTNEVILRGPEVFDNKELALIAARVAYPVLTAILSSELKERKK